MAKEGTSAAKSVASSATGSKVSSSLAGRRIKRFRLIEELGEGAMGRVYVAEDTVLRRHVALKLLPAKHKDGRPNHRTERLITEARSAANLEHPNVVTVHEIDQSGGVHYIAMELVEGGNLERLVQMSGPLDVERACQLAAEAAEALAHAHKRGIVHRDVKPANLLLTRSGRCKVCDFGLALIEVPDGDAARMKCVGTPYFIAPEIAQGKGATAASDIYSLGCTLFFLLTGRPPFPGTSSKAVMKSHISDPLPDLRQWRPDVPPRLVEAIEQACAKDPAKRIDDAERFAKILRTFTIPTAGSSAGLGSSNQLTPFEAIAAPNGSPAPGMSAAQSQQLPAVAAWRVHSPLVWAGAATLATALLIALGMWLVRPGPSKAGASTPPAAQQPGTLFPDAPAVVTSPSTPVAPLPSTAVVNGSMEDGDNTLSGWFIHDRFKAQTKLLTENGNRFLRLNNDDPAKTVFADQKIVLDPSWRALTVSARMRAVNFKPGKAASQDGRVAFAFHDAAGNRIGNWPPVPNVRQDCGWIERTVTADVPKGAATMYIQLAIFNATGTVDFDDVAVVPQK